MQWFPARFRVENLRKGAEPVNNAAIIDMIQTNIFEDIGCGEMAVYITHIARANPAPYPNGNGPVICYAPNAKFPQILLAPAAIEHSIKLK